MAIIEGKRFTQLNNLNVIGEFRVKGTQLGKPLIEAKSVSADQNPVAVDTPVQIEFGPAQDNKFFSLSSAGTLTCKRDGFYLFDAALRLGREAVPQAAFVFVRVTVNDVQAGPPAAVTLSENRIVIPLQFLLVLQLNIGDQVKAEMYRDSAGTNDGGLFSQASSIGWGSAPCSTVAVYNFE